MRYVKRLSVVSRLSKRSSISEKVRILRRVYSKKVCQPVSFWGVRVLLTSYAQQGGEHSI
jgi:hypothetical protein